MIKLEKLFSHIMILHYFLKFFQLLLEFTFMDLEHDEMVKHQVEDLINQYQMDTR